MEHLFRSIKRYVIQHDLIPPALHREYWFLKSHARYLRRRLWRRNEWRAVAVRPPILVGFNTTGACDAACCYCVHRFHAPDGVMTMAIYEKGIRDFSEMGGGTVGLSPLTGEPLLDPHFADRIEYASRFENITGVTFDTNGLLLRREAVRETLVRLAATIPIHMNISLPGFDGEMVERVYNVPWDESVLHGIRSLLEVNRGLGAPLDIDITLQPDRPGAVRERIFRTMIRPLIDGRHVLNVGLLRDNWCGQITQEHLTGAMTLKRDMARKNIPCEVLLDRHADILANGDVRMCGCRFGPGGKHDDLVIGNIGERSLSEIWFGEGIRRLCERFFSGDVPAVCRECSMYMPY